MRLASRADFFGGIYTHYRRHEGYANRAKLFEPYPDPILVAGCGFGFLVEEFLRLGRSAWGIDAAEYCIENRENDNVWLCDITSGNDVGLLLAQRGSFGTVITEDLLPHLTDEEAIIAAKNCSLLGRFVIHLVTESGEHKELNYRPAGQWQLKTGQPTLSLEGM